MNEWNKESLYSYKDNVTFGCCEYRYAGEDETNSSHNPFYSFESNEFSTWVRMTEFESLIFEKTFNANSNEALIEMLRFSFVGQIKYFINDLRLFSIEWKGGVPCEFKCENSTTFLLHSKLKITKKYYDL